MPKFERSDNKKLWTHSTSLVTHCV